MKQLKFLFVGFLLCSCIETEAPQTWYKGNTHAHTLYSDGDSYVSDVVQWYHDNAYNFLLVTDHNYPLVPDTIQFDRQRGGDFLLIPGNEVSDVNAVHTTSIGTDNFIQTIRYYRNAVKRGELPEEILNEKPQTKTGMLQMHVMDILASGGIPVANHPNFLTGLQVSDILPVKEVRHLELFNGHPLVYNWGNDIHQSVEQKWDSLLVNRRLFYGLAADDEHAMKEWDREKANPGRGWIMVEAAALTQKELMSAIDKGRFYASTGVILDTYKHKNNRLTIRVNKNKTLAELAAGRGYYHQDAPVSKEGFCIEFIGYNGKVLKTISGLKGSYTVKLKDKYLRGRVSYTVREDGMLKTYYAWGQPIETEPGYFIKE